MNERTAACTLMLFLIMPLFMQPGASFGMSREITETPDGLRWHEPLRVTDNDLDDYYPTLDLGPDGMAHVVYLQSGTNEMWSKVDGPGDDVEFSDELLYTGFIPTQYQVKEKSTEQPSEHFVVDGEGRLHAIWMEKGLLDNKYQRFDADGRADMEKLDIAQIAELSRLPYLVVGKNDRAYIAFENEGTAWVQMTYVTDGDSLKAPVLIGRPGENVAYVADDDGNIHLFYRSLGADVSMYYTKLNPNRGFIVKPKILFPHTSEVANPYSSMPTLSTSPNGHVHLLLSSSTIAPHPIYYAELDENGDILHNFTRIVDRSHNYGDIEGDGANGAYVVWDDVADGEVHYTRIYDGVKGEEHVITDTGGAARYPQLRLGEHDALHITWASRAGGDGEVHYRYAENFRVTAEVSEDLGDLRPDQTIEADLVVMNSGDLPNTITVTTSVEMAGKEGWDLSLGDDPIELEMAPMEERSVHFTVTTPSHDVGRDGDSIAIRFHVGVERASAKDVVLRVEPTLSVGRGMVIGDPGAVPVLGDDVSVGFDLVNNGDVGETVRADVIGAPDGWSFSGACNGTFAPGAADVFEFDVTGPVSEPDGSIVRVDVLFTVTEIGNSSGTPGTVEVLRFVYLHLRPDVFISVDAGELAWSDDGRTAVSELYLRNLGEGTGRVTPEVLMIRGTSDWGIAFIDIGGAPVSSFTVDDEAAYRLVVTAPADAARSKPALFSISFGAWATVVFEARVPVMRGIAVEPVDGDPLVMAPGETSHIWLTIRNEGNVPEDTIPDLTGTVPDVPFIWKFGLEEPLLDVGLAPYEERTVPLSIDLSENAAMVADLPLKVGVMDIYGVSYATDIKLTVERKYGVDMVANVTSKTADSGDEVSFETTVVNTGNAEDVIAMTILDVPWGWDFTVENLLTGSMGAQVVPAGGSVDMVFTLVPRNVSQDALDIIAVAGSPSGIAAHVPLHVDILLPDLVVIDIDPEDDPWIGDTIDVEVVIENKGKAPAEADVYMIGPDPDADMGPQTVTLLPGTQKELTFNMKLIMEEQNITVVVDRYSRVHESNEANNVATIGLKAERKGLGSTPGFGLLPAVMSLLMVSLLIGILSSRYND